jgi:hypothetical protein
MVHGIRGVRRRLALVAVLVGCLVGTVGGVQADEGSVSASVDKACVAPLGLQGITVHTTPSDVVAYSTEYADQSNELSNPTYRTGSGSGTADASGLFRATWRVPPTAPLGPAHLHYIAGAKLRGPVDFTVGLPLVTCPLPIR